MVRIQGDNIDCPGQVSIGSAPSLPAHAVRHDDERLRQRGTASLSAIPLNDAAPVDVAEISIDADKYLPFKVLLFRPTADVSDAQIGIYTGPLGTGVEIVAPTTLLRLDAETKFQLLEITDLTELISTPSLFVFLTNASALEGEVDLFLWYHDLSSAFPEIPPEEEPIEEEPPPEEP